MDLNNNPRAWAEKRFFVLRKRLHRVYKLDTWQQHCRGIDYLKDPPAVCTATVDYNRARYKRIVGQIQGELARCKTILKGFGLKV